MPEDDLTLLAEAARRAGRLAAQMQGQGVRSWEKPGGAGPVSEADIAVDAALREDLLGARPDYGWLSEETEDDPARLARERVFIVDPIDGTRNFIDGGRTWALSLAVAHRGAVVAAAVHLPARDKMYLAAAGGGASLNGAPIAVSRRESLEGAQVLAARAGLDPASWRGPVPGMRRAFRPSLAYRLALVAEGRFDAMLTLRPSWEWDIAAGALIVCEAGGAATDRRGRALEFNRPEPKAEGILAANVALHASLAGCIAA